MPVYVDLLAGEDRCVIVLGALVQMKKIVQDMGHVIVQPISVIVILAMLALDAKISLVQVFIEQLYPILYVMKPVDLSGTGFQLILVALTSCC